MFNNLFKKRTPGPIMGVLSANTNRSFPFYVQAALILLVLTLLFNTLAILEDILVPICFAGLIAILLNPLVNKLVVHKVPRTLSIGLALLIAITVAVGIVTFISAQLASFSELAPQLKQRSTEILDNVTAWISERFNITREKQLAKLEEGVRSGQAYIGQTLNTVMGIIGVVVLLPIYTFLILYYKPLFLHFFYEVVDDKHEDKVTEVLNETKTAIQKYIQGLLIELLIVASMNSVALLILGVQYPILLGIIGALLNLIPYIGGLVAISLPVVMSLVTGDGTLTTPALIIGAYVLIQFIDNNIIVPRVVSSKVEVNAFFSIVIVLLGGLLWGVAGMFLSIPFVAICKIIFDRVDSLKPWGHLLGTRMDRSFTLKHLETTETPETVQVEVKESPPVS